jgi:hypothetical protein
MKRLALVLAIALLAGGVGYGVIGWRHAAAARRLEAARGADLAWIRAEFALDDAQFAAVVALHDAYRPVCAGHCAAIASAAERIAALRQASAAPAEIAAAESALADLEQVCNNATRDHIHRVAAHMSPEQGRRYLQMIEPHLARQSHDPAQRDGLRH